MKRYPFISAFFVILFLFILYGQSVFASYDILPLLGKVIYVDAGHGGRDAGAIFGSIYEKDINLAISKALSDSLLKRGATVYMIRDDDSDLSEDDDILKKRGDLQRRVKAIDESNAQLYLSIHVNAFKDDPSQKGAEVLYNSVNSLNKLLADTIMDYFKKDLGSTRHVSMTDLYLYTNSQTPGVLIECGYLTNSTERQLLLDSTYQEKLGEVIADGVVDYFRKASKAPTSDNNVLKSDDNYIRF